MALYAFPSPFWALPTLFLSAPAAASIAFINSVGNLGGFVGPYVIGFLSDKRGTYQAGVFYLVASGLVGGLLVLALRPGFDRQFFRCSNNKWGLAGRHIQSSKRQFEIATPGSFKLF
jgi:MFS family permease